MSCLVKFSVVLTLVLKCYAKRSLNSSSESDSQFKPYQYFIEVKKSDVKEAASDNSELANELAKYHGVTNNDALPLAVLMKLKEQTISRIVEDISEEGNLDEGYDHKDKDKRKKGFENIEATNDNERDETQQSDDIGAVDHKESRVRRSQVINQFLPFYETRSGSLTRQESLPLPSHQRMGYYDPREKSQIFPDHFYSHFQPYNQNTADSRIRPRLHQNDSGGNPDRVMQHDSYLTNGNKLDYYSPLRNNHNNIPDDEENPEQQRYVEEQGDEDYVTTRRPKKKRKKNKHRQDDDLGYSRYPSGYPVYRQPQQNRPLYYPNTPSQYNPNHKVVPVRQPGFFERLFRSFFRKPNLIPPQRYPPPPPYYPYQTQHPHQNPYFYSNQPGRLDLDAYTERPPREETWRDNDDISDHDDIEDDHDGDQSVKQNVIDCSFNQTSDDEDPKMKGVGSRIQCLKYRHFGSKPLDGDAFEALKSDEKDPWEHFRRVKYESRLQNALGNEESG